MIISSPAFENGGIIPQKYTSDGENINPPLQIANVPDFAKSLIITFREEDDSGRGPFHWFLYNLDSQIKKIDEGKIPKGAMEGKNNFGKYGYTGPSLSDNDQAIGTHYYVFRAYALDCEINLKADVLDTNLLPHQLIKNIGCNIIDSAKIIGFYNPN